MADDSVQEILPGNACAASPHLNGLTVISSSRVSLEIKKLGVIDVTELVQVSEVLYQVPRYYNTVVYFTTKKDVDLFELCFIWLRPQRWFLACRCSPPGNSISFLDQSCTTITVDILLAILQANL